LPKWAKAFFISLERLIKQGDKTMAGTKAGGQAAAATNKSKYGADFYAKIGAKGGKLGKTGGFYANRELARAAGAKGGRISRRVKKTA
jgi:general stress protein YciG